MPAIQVVAAVAVQAAVLAHAGIPEAAHILLLAVKLAPMALIALWYCQQVEMMAAEVRRTAASVRRLQPFAQRHLSWMLIELVAVKPHLDFPACL